jgi:hypothetical protein
VYSWRLTSETKAELERAARRANRSMGGLLDSIVRGWLDAMRSDGTDAADQKRLHHAASECIGVLRGGNPLRAEQARGTIRARLASRHARHRPD